MQVNIQHVSSQEVLRSNISSYHLRQRSGYLLNNMYCLARVANAIRLEMSLELGVIIVDARNMPDVKPHCFDILCDFGD